MPTPKELVQELMVRDDAAFHGARVKNFFDELNAAGYVIVPKERAMNEPGWWRTDVPRPHNREDGIPTRVDLRWYTSAEIAIAMAMAHVEKAGASPALTDAIVHLSEAKNCVADHVESAERVTI